MTLFTGTTAPPSAGTRDARRYDQIRAADTRRNRRASKAARDIGDLPPVADPERRAAAAASFRRHCEAYMPATFALPWSPDHLRVIDRIEQATRTGGLFAFAMPRGSGKTSLVIAAATWALVNGFQQFVAIIGADEQHARRMLDAIALELETNDALLADYPEVCQPLRALERIHQRARGQLHNGKPTRIVRTAAELVLPTIDGSAASGAVVRVAGITGHLRGMTAKRPDGSTIRPGLVLIDDPATDEVANSPTQVAGRLEILRGAILGLAGPGRTIAGLCTVTVIKPGDLADQLLNRDAHPEWQGERTQLVYAWPDRADLWTQYAEIRKDGLRNGGGTAAATDFYRQHRADMDAGAAVGWPARFSPGQLSALQHAYDLQLDRGDAAFAAEYQNAPLVPTLAAAAIDADLIRSRIVPLNRGIVPSSHSTLTAAIDVQERLLYWLVASWGPAFSGHVIAYGTYPDQSLAVFTAGAARRTLAHSHPGAGFEARLLAALNRLTDEILGRSWKREDGSAGRVESLVVDANWGRSTATVREFARRHAAAAVIHPAHGRGITASSRPMHDHKRRPGERSGPGWRLTTVGGQRGLLFDSNHAKTWIAGRLTTPVGDPGALTLHRGEHPLLIDHLTAEQPVSVTARGHTVDEWKLAPARENHLLDCLTMATVGASVAGVTAVGATAEGRARRKVSPPPRGQPRARIHVQRRR